MTATLEVVALTIMRADEEASSKAEGAAEGLSENVSDWAAYVARAATDALLQPTAGQVALTGEELDELERVLRSADARSATFEGRQSSDESGEYYPTRANLTFESGPPLSLLTGLTSHDDWTFEDFEALCAAFNAAPRLIAQARLALLPAGWQGMETRVSP